MKTSLVLDDRLFRAARQEAQRNGKTLSETISHWARVGWEALRRERTTRRTTFHAVDLGGAAAIDLHSRRDWMDTLDR